MNLKALLSTALAVAVTIVPSIAIAQEGPIDRKEYVCMMQDAVQLKPGIPIEHEGKTYYGCCPMCSKKITRDPEKYTKATDPVTKAKVDKATAFIYGHQGSAYYFESEESRRKFGESPGAFLKKSS